MAKFNQCFLIITLIVSLGSATVHGKWWEYRNGNTRILSDENKVETIRLARQVDDLKVCLELVFPNFTKKQAMPATVFFSGNSKKNLYYDVNEHGYLGLMLRDNEGAITVVTNHSRFIDSRAIFSHEYIHYITSTDSIKPLWLVEGIACLFASVHRNLNDELVIGEPLDTDLVMLQLFDLMPTATLFEVARGEYCEEDPVHSGLFYSQSWLLVHYLLFGQTEFEREDVQTFIARSAATSSTQEEILIEELGINFSELDERLENYRKNGKFTQYKIPLKKLRQLPKIRLSRPDPRELDFEIARFNNLIHYPEDSDSLLLELEEKWPRYPEFLSLRGDWVARLNQDFSDARTFYEEAYSLGSRSPRTCIGLATSILDAHGCESESGPFPETQNLDEELAKLCLGYLNAAKRHDIFESIHYITLRGRLILCSKDTPSEADVEYALSALERYPYHFEIADLAARILDRFGQNQMANALRDKYDLQNSETNASQHLNQ